jgi:hypothetical protein
MLNVNHHKSAINGPFSTAMLNNQRVIALGWNKPQFLDDLLVQNPNAGSSNVNICQ